ncbi:organoarsenical effux MFS transporter ArsJ [Shewanella surugensis]|uniref:Organoarsenical effux MFS transporter ArsJ n=1 Tax=Shewanella surugensis TaxID=212020 RepID=A0ABT0LB73_9GAMM|nr:organoarsenical effux MFS transporter ArsJ [Shewanella surugensis]MCL1124824.1 organoarsenical effux MFS transporter ArsJ [Shewanella surugensis]
MLTKIQSLPLAVRQYLLITSNYWFFTLTDGALRMLVVLHFYQLGYDALAIATLFLFYEAFGVVTNLLGGWLGARIGLNRTMNIGLGLQVVALSMLLVPPSWLIVPWVMAAQALSGIAKDLNKMSAKSAIKTLVPKNEKGKLYQWVAWLTGSKNALKGVGFFLGGLLLSLMGFTDAITLMAIALALVWLLSLLLLKEDLGKTNVKPKFNEIFSKSRSINLLSAARLCLFASRDVWFVVALPVYLSSQLGWTQLDVGAFLAAWIIVYGLVQSQAPKITRSHSKLPDGGAAVLWMMALTMSMLLMALAMDSLIFDLQWTLAVGLVVFGVVFAINSSLHSYLIVSYAREDGASLDIGFYYMANAAGRLIGTLLSGWLYQISGLQACLYMALSFLVLTMLLSLFLPRNDKKSE